MSCVLYQHLEYFFKMQSKINYLNSLFSEWLFLDQSTNIKTEVTFKSYNAKLIYLMQEICAALLYLYTV